MNFHSTTKKVLCSSPTPQLSNRFFVHRNEDLQAQIHLQLFVFEFANRSVELSLCSLEKSGEDSLRSDPAFQLGEFSLGFSVKILRRFWLKYEHREPR
ncbi:hypothetical protein L2E82_10776 [Cichorium intybus]|uniref:Uncharacterized protein n=1 Tax=Cichorium intybus TaxID=13427 RepID=A0ACB9GCM3_CICIN|nr:hypothetical protein L2E82_10776 [Cichorium intybus]